MGTCLSTGNGRVSAAAESQYVLSDVSAMRKVDTQISKEIKAEAAKANAKIKILLLGECAVSVSLLRLHQQCVFLVAHIEYHVIRVMQVPARVARAP
jgi:cytidylate kinase